MTICEAYRVFGIALGLTAATALCDSLGGPSLTCVPTVGPFQATEFSVAKSGTSRERNSLGPSLLILDKIAYSK